MKKILALFLTVGFLAACSSTPEPVDYSLSFKDQKPIELYVSDIEVVKEYKPTMAAPNVDHLFQIPPSQAASIWAKDRLAARGGAYTVRYIIRDASVTEKELPISKGITGWFKSEPSARFDGKLAVTAELVRPDGTVEAFANARAQSSREIMEDTSLEEKEQAWFEMSKEMALFAGTELEKQIQTNFVSVLGPPSS